MQWQVSDTQANRKLNAKDVERHPWLCWATKSSSAVGKKAKLQAKSGKFKMWCFLLLRQWLGAVLRVLAQQGHLWAENDVWAWKSKIEILPDRRREKLMLEPLLMPPDAEVAKCLSSRDLSHPYRSTVTQRHFWETLSDSDTEHQKLGRQANWQAGSWSVNLSMLQHQVAMTSQTGNYQYCSVVFLKKSSKTRETTLQPVHQRLAWEFFWVML